MDERVSARAAGYMELPGATKDADCKRVKVSGGVARTLGCCNLFGWDSAKAKRFSCGTCEYVIGKSLGQMEKALTR